MGSTVIGIVGSYRKGGTIDSAVSATLEGAAAAGATTEKIYLLDEEIGFCTNCRTCMQGKPEARRGECVQKDAMANLMDKIDAADAVVLGAPVNMGSTAALMKRFVERLAPYSYWPWGKARAPVNRIVTPDKKAVVITSSASPAVMGRVLMPGALGQLKQAARSMGAEVTKSLYFGFARSEKDSTLSEADLDRARAAGRRLR